MSEQAHLEYYGGDGILKTYDQHKEKSYGGKMIKKEVKRAEARAQLALEKKASKCSAGAEKNTKKCSAGASGSTNTAAEDGAIHHHDPVPVPPPSNQLVNVQKRCHAPSTTHESPAQKQGRQDSPTPADEEEQGEKKDQKEDEDEEEEGEEEGEGDEEEGNKTDQEDEDEGEEDQEEGNGEDYKKSLSPQSSPPVTSN